MRADLSTIQQTLTPEAAAALGLAMDEAARRRHGQTTPLHVVAALLAAPAGLLRTACARTAAAGHPLQCRALELCFSVALDRLPAAAAAAAAVAQGAGAASPVSNALVAALKRAQAQQRRGCPEAAQQPLLAVKVELDQLVLSILDDPSVSRVMKEASFSSAAIKSTIEHFLTSSPSKASTITTASISSPSPASLPLATSRSGNPYLNPRLAAASSGACTGEDAKKVLDIMLKPSRRNPVLVGDAGPDAVLKEALLRIPTSGSATLAGAKVLPLEAEFVALAGDKLSITARIAKLSAAVEKLVREGGGAVLELGDLKWLLDGPAASESGKAAVAEMGRLLRRFGPGSLWAVGTATCATYLRCKVYHPLMEAEWDLHAVPIARTAPLPMSLMNARPCPSPTPSPIHGLPAVAPRPLRRPESTERAAEKPVMCQLCKAGHERELAKIVAEWTDRTPGPGLPHWLQLGADKTQSKEQELKWKKSTEELEKKWRETCASIHLSVSLPLPLSAQTLSMPLRALGPGLPVEPKLLLANRMRADTLTMNRNWEWSPGRPVKTDLVLGSFREKVETDAPKEGLTDVQKAKIAEISDIESFKRLLKGLTEKVAWQSDAASAIAATVIQCRSGDGKRRSSGQKGDMWLLFIGPDQVGKRKMASALSELMANTSPVVVNIGTEGKCGPNVGFWGKTFLDRVAEAVRQNPFSVIMLNGIDQANDVMRGKIKRAMETGRLLDSRGRDVSLGNVIFVLTANWIPEELSGSANQELLQEEAKLADIASSSWQLELAVGDIWVKHRADWDSDNGRPRKMTKELYTGPRLSLDLNLAVGSLNHTDGSRNSSDVTVEHGQDQQGKLAVRCSTLSPVCELLDLVDDAIVFRPVDFRPVRKTVSDCILSKFKSVICSGCSFTVNEDVVNRLVGTVWFTEEKLDDWAEKVLAPSFERMSRNLKRDGGCAVVLRLALATDNVLPRRGEAWEGLPSTVTIAVDGTPTGNQCK